MVRFANRARGLPKADRDALIEEWELRVARGDTPRDAALRLALLLGDPADPDRSSPDRARRLLESYLADAGNPHEGLREFARYRLAQLEAGSDEALTMVRFAARAHGMTKGERAELVRRWEQRLAQDRTSSSAALHLAVLLGNPGRNNFGELSRARQLLESYVAENSGKSEALLAFAKYQLSLLDEGERWLRAAERERRARVELEQKLEALKAIEQRMTDRDANDKVPLQ